MRDPLPFPARRGRRLLVALCTLAVALGLLSAVHPPTAARGSSQERPDTEPKGRPNIVLVMADDMRVDDLLFAPQVRRLVARTGVTFRNSFSPYPLCCPARASLLTGQYAHNHEVLSHMRPWGFGAFDDSRTLATSLREAGYRTGFVGKYLNGYGVHRARTGGPSVRYVPPGWDDWRGSLDGGPGTQGSTYNYMRTPFNVNGRIDNSHGGEYSTNVVGSFSVAMARRFSRGHDPFFMYVNFLAPHIGGPREPDDVRRLRDARGRAYTLLTPARPRWVRGRFDRLVTRAAGLPRDGGPSEADIRDKPLAFAREPEPTAVERRAMRGLTRQRAESIFVMDREIGRLVRQLKRTGEWDDTVFVFTSDNGYYLGEHRRRQGKVRAHEPSLRVPFVITGPGLPGGQLRADPVSTVDVTATLLDLADVAPPRPADGVSVVGSIAHGDRGWTRPIVTEGLLGRGSSAREPGFDDRRSYIGVRTARYSYIRNRAGKDELYDLWADPRQQRNVIARRSYRGARTALSAVWRDVHSCRASRCGVDLPASLQADAAELRRLTQRYWQVVRDAYAFDR